MLIGTDRNIFIEGSTTRRRIQLLGDNYCDALDTIVFSDRRHNITTSQKIGDRVYGFPTNSISRIFRIWDAYTIAKKLPKPDIVSSQDPFETGLVAFLIAQYWQIPFVVEMHTDLFTPEYTKHSFINKIQKIISLFILRHASAAYCVSHTIKQKVSKRYPGLPISVLPIYVNIEKFKHITHTQHPRFKTSLLWIGRMEEEKNPELALHAFIEIRKKGLDVGLTFVGDGRLTHQLQAKAKQAHVSEYVEFVGNQNDVRPYYAQANLLLVTSTYEGYGMVIIEALACTIPVLSTDVGIAREAGAIIAEKDYSSALYNLLSHPYQQGNLTLHTYANEEEYFSKIQQFYKQHTSNNP
jgi:glycosyltransferase involved in cell wall biosynthesis